MFRRDVRIGICNGHNFLFYVKIIFGLVLRRYLDPVGAGRYQDYSLIHLLKSFSETRVSARAS